MTSISPMIACSIIPYHENMAYHACQAEIDLLLKQTGGLKKSYCLAGGVAYLNRQNEKTILFREQKSQYLFLFHCGLEDAYHFFIENFMDTQRMELKNAYFLLQIAEMLNQEESFFYRLFPLLKWQISKKGLLFYRALKEFAPVLLTKVLEKKVNLNDAFLFHNQFKQHYQAVFDQIPGRLTFSELSQTLRYLTECSRKYQLSLEQIMMQVESRDREQFLAALYQLRYPLYQKYYRKMTDFIKQLKLPGQVKIHFDRTFESSQYQMEIGFKTMSDLSSKINLIEQQLKKQAAKKEQLDLFDQNKLFEEDL